MRLPLRKAVAIEVIILLVGGALILPGGEDLYSFYLPIARGCPECGYNPWFASWVLFPIRFVPVRYLWAVWVLFTGVVVYWSAERLQTNSAFVLLAFPMMGQMWLGQIDAVVLLGLMLILFFPNAYLRGAGIVLASIKPHITAPALLILWWYDKERWKTLLVPSAVLVLSLAVWGIDWPLRWWRLRDLDASLPVWGHAAIFPYGLAAFPTIFLVKDVRKKVTAALLAMALSVPSFGVYSFVVFLVFIAPWWAIPLSYAWAIAYPWYGNMALRFAWILPVGLLIYLLRPVIEAYWTRVKVAIERRRANPC
ncbi:MAG: hypothetical protein JXB07_04115 [Anaerolineae bacterium]|nr:hypothetical protein [Anaerolineae bacterium]